MQLNTNQGAAQMGSESLEQYICKVERLTQLVKRSRQKEETLGRSEYYTIFGTDQDMLKAVAFQKSVTARIAGYLKSVLFAYTEMERAELAQSEGRVS